jgi:hypothetical protein
MKACGEVTWAAVSCHVHKYWYVTGVDITLMEILCRLIKNEPISLTVGFDTISNFEELLNSSFSFLKVRVLR